MQTENTEVGGIIKSWCILLFPLLKIQLPLVSASPTAGNSIFPRGWESSPLFGNANIHLCGQVQPSPVLGSHQEVIPVLKEKLLGPTWAFPASFVPGMPSRARLCPGHAHMQCSQMLLPPAGICPLGCKWTGLIPPFLSGTNSPALLEMNRLCWEMCQHLRKGARLYFLLKSASNSICQSFTVKKNVIFLIEVRLKFPANHGFIPPGAWRGSAKGMKGNLQEMHSFSTFFPQKSQHFWHILLRCNSEISAVF